MPCERHTPHGPHNQSPRQVESPSRPAYRELEMLVILRMNRDFMDFMRTNYAAEASKYMKQQFGCTVVAWRLS